MENIEDPAENLENIDDSKHISENVEHVNMENSSIQMAQKRKITHKQNKQPSTNDCEWKGPSAALRTHKREKHRGIKLNCDQCDYVTVRSGRLKVHKASKHEGIRHKCEQCEYSAPSREGLKSHKKIKHGGVRHSCDQCDYTASTLLLLKHHNESKHKGIRYACDQCNYAASLLSHLKIHKESIHEGIRYSCDQCHHSSTQINDLKRHKEVIHNSVYQKHKMTALKVVRHPCDKCDHAATSLSNLKHHQKYNCRSLILTFNKKDEVILDKKLNQVSADPEKISSVSDTLVPVELRLKKEGVAGSGPPSTISCNVCSKTFPNSNLLTIHKWIHIGQETPVKKERIGDDQFVVKEEFEDKIDASIFLEETLREEDMCEMKQEPSEHD